MPPPNPGVQRAGAVAGAAAANPASGPSNIGGVSGGGTFKVDTSGVDALHRSLQTVINDITQLSRAVDTLTGKLNSAGSAANGAFGGGQQGTKSRNMGAPVSTPYASRTANAIAGLATGAVGEAAATLGGRVNTVMGAVVSAGNQTTSVMGAQAASIFGGGSAGQYANSYAGGISALSTADLSQAVATMQANPMLFAARGSSKQKQLNNFLNTITKLNPNMSAAQAAQVANTLASGPALQAMQRFGGRNGQIGQGLVNPKTMGINSTNQVFSEMLQTVMGGRQLNSQQMKQMAGNSPQATRIWNAITQNNNVPGMGLGLSPQMLTELRQYAASGGNLSSLEQQESNLPATTKRQAAASGVQASTAAYGATAGEQNVVNRAHDAFNKLITSIIGIGGGVGSGTTSAVAAFGDVTKAALSLVATFTEVAASVKILTGKGGGGGSGGVLGNIFGKGKTTTTAETAEEDVAGAGEAEAGGGGLLGILGSTALGSKLGGTALGGLASKVLGKGMLGSGGLKAGLGGLGLSIGGGLLGQIIAGGHGGARGQTGAAVAGAGKDAGLGMMVGGPWGALIGAGLGAGASEIESHFGKDINNWSKSKNPFEKVGGSVLGHVLSFLGDPVTGATNTSGLSPQLAARFTAMRAANPSLQISSGKRSTAQQAAVYALKGPGGAVPPGQSAHQTGLAADVGPPSQFGWISKNASKYGLYNPSSSEPWHLQAMGDPTGNQIVQKAEMWVSTPTPYKYGGNGTQPGQGVDCSRFVQEVYAECGVNLPRTTYEQCQLGTVVKGIGSAQPGDLIFYDYEGPNSHVAIYIGGNKQIAAPETGQNVQIQNVDTGHITQIRRIVSGGAGAAAAGVASAAAGVTQASGSSGGSALGLASSFIASVGANNNWMGAIGGASTPVGTPSTGTAPAASSAQTSSASNAPSSITGSHSQLISQALQLAGVPQTPGNISAVNTIVTHESGWNPSAINMTDSNAKAGHPSTGLMQTIASTFAEYALPGYNQSMTNPLDDLIAGIRYAVSRYGSLGNVPGVLAVNSGRSYVGYDSGGVLPPGITVAVNATGQNERIVRGGGVGSSSRGSVTINMPVQVVNASQQEAQRLAQMVIAQLQSEDQMAQVSQD